MVKGGLYETLEEKYDKLNESVVKDQKIAILVHNAHQVEVDVPESFVFKDLTILGGGSS